MTFGELKRAVIHLGFERGLEDDEYLMPALSRALYTLFNDIGVIATRKIPRPKTDVELIFDTMAHTPTSTESFVIGGNACSFTVSGEGSYTLNSGATSRTYSFSSDMLPVRLFTIPGSILSFEGSLSFTVFDLAVAKSTRSSLITDIPIWSELDRVNLGRRYPDFIAPDGEPTGADGKPIAGARVENGVLHLPHGYCGQVFISYRRAPNIPSGIEDEELDIPKGAEELLPLLVASYIWLDDAPDKAQYYMSLYLDGVRAYKRVATASTATGYVTNGWA